MNRNAILAVVGAAAGGVAVGFVTGRAYWEKICRAEYAEATEGMRRSFEIAAEIRKKSVPTVDEIDFNEVAVPVSNYFFGSNDVPQVFTVRDNQGTSAIEIDPPLGIDTPKENTYHKAIAAVETPVELFVDGGVNDYGMSYIEEEEYEEEDGRYKGKIDILMDDHNPIFMMDGQEIDDWDQRIGDSILVDFYRLVPPNVDPILYVRNHRTDEDYEVVRVIP